jgi:hypothetical protein
MEVSSQPHAPAALTPGKKPRYPLNMRGRREEKYFAPYRDSNSDTSAFQPVAIPTELSRLLLRGVREPKFKKQYSTYSVRKSKTLGVLHFFKQYT